LEIDDGYFPAGSGTRVVVVADRDPAGRPDPDAEAPQPAATIPTRTANPIAPTRLPLRTGPRVMEGVGMAGVARSTQDRTRSTANVLGRPPTTSTVVKRHVPGSKTA
jgi:hypothetical protein